MVINPFETLEKKNGLMKNNLASPFFTTQASLWDGSNQLLGNLEIWERDVVFNFEDFKYSHLNLSIPISIIDKVEEYLIFDLARNGLRIQNKNGKYDLFVFDEVARFKKKLLERVSALGGF